MLEKAYQAFFSNLFEFIYALKSSDKQVFHESADLILYRGKVFRYLGNSCLNSFEGKITPVYNDVYVSWSKMPTNSYIESKLRGTMTWLYAEIHEPYYGIDLEGLERAIYSLVGIEYALSRGNEHEVIFPTIKECIKEIKYIDYEESKDEQT